MTDAQKAATHLKRTMVSGTEYQRRLKAGLYKTPAKTEWGQAFLALGLDVAGNLTSQPPANSTRSIFDGPGLFTDTAGTRERAEFFADLLGEGRWVVQQAQNGDTASKPTNLSYWVQFGFKVGVWGVTYDPANFARDGAALAKRANDLVVDLLVIDAEECLKNADPTPLIDALAAYPGPKALSTYGAASGSNVFPIDYKAFTDAGYHVLPQAYRQIAPEYEPQHCMEHAARAGIPRDRTHLSIYTTNSASDVKTPVSAQEYVAMLKQAGVGRDVSLFMPEFEFDYAALEPVYA